MESAGLSDQAGVLFLSAHPPSLMVRRRGAPSRTMSWPGSERAAILRDARKGALLRMRGRVRLRGAFTDALHISAPNTSLMVRRRDLSAVARRAKAEAPSRTMSWPGSERAAILRDARKGALLRMRGRVRLRGAFTDALHISAPNTSLMVRRRDLSAVARRAKAEAPSRTMSWPGSERAAILRDAR